jgi:hypothetical protein
MAYANNHFLCKTKANTFAVTSSLEVIGVESNSDYKHKRYCL